MMKRFALCLIVTLFAFAAFDAAAQDSVKENAAFRAAQETGHATSSSPGVMDL